MEKEALRKIYREKRNKLTSAEIEVMSKQIKDNFLQYFDLAQYQNIHIFLPIERQKEVNTWDLIHYFWDNARSVFVPKINDNEIESHFLAKNSILSVNDWGIPEPQNSPVENINYDMVITPLLYCDNQGNRIGYGKGFYDKFFRNINDNALKIGVNFFPPSEKIINISALDIPLDYLITPTEVLSFSNFISKSTK